MNPLGGIRFASQIATAAAAHGLDPQLLAAVAAQETGGPGSNSGNNVVGDGGHGHGLFQIDDRTWAFARTPAAMDPAQNADAAATILAGDLQRYGSVRSALAAYNAGSPEASGTQTTWPDGATLGYADSVLRHYAALGGGGAAATASQFAPAAFSTPNTAGTAGPQMPPLCPQVLPPAPPIPTGDQAQAAASVGAQADDLLAGLVDQGNVFDANDD